MGYVYLALPISGFFLTLYSAEFMLERIVALSKGEIEEHHLEEDIGKTYE
jgi:TRAP-type C4-dicarboxylate transport system permease small subunit